MFGKLLLACLVLTFSLTFPHYGDGGEKVCFSLLSFLILFSTLYSPKRHIKFYLPFAFVALLTWQGAQTTEIYVRFSYVNLLLAVVALYQVSNRINMSVERFGAFLFFLVSVNTLLLLGQELKLTDYLVTSVYPSPHGFLLFPWASGVFAVLSIPFLWAYKKRSVLVLLPMIFFSHSMICMAAACVAMMFLLWESKYLRPAILGVLVFAGVFIKFSDRHIDEHRFKIWSKALAYSKDLKLGNGLGTWAHKGFRRDIGNDLKTWWRWAHNEFYQVLFETGIAGLVVMLGYFWHLFSVQDRRLKCFIGLVGLMAFFHPIFHAGKLAIFLIIALAIVEHKKHTQTRLA